jgi:hypothetical protein
VGGPHRCIEFVAEFRYLEMAVTSEFDSGGNEEEIEFM